MTQTSKNQRHPTMLAPLLLSVCLLATGCSSAAAPPRNLISVTAMPPQPLTFYEGEDDIEPFTPFIAAPGPQGSVLTFGYADREGAYYITTYDGRSWQETGISNGFAPTDPLWECDAAPEDSTTFAPDARLMARTCPDGSATIFTLPEALPAYHIPGAVGSGALTARTPAAIFAPQSNRVALTNDGPQGAGTQIMLLDTSTWRPARVIPVSAGLLSRPAWSPDGALIAAVDLAGMLHIWNAASGAEVGHITLPTVALADAPANPATPAPLWSPNGATLYVTTPTAQGSLLTAWNTSDPARLSEIASYPLPEAPAVAQPQLAPGGSRIFAHAGPGKGIILAARELVWQAAFALPGNLVIWGGDDQTLDAFTLQATVAPLRLGGATGG